MCAQNGNVWNILLFWNDLKCSRNISSLSANKLTSRGLKTENGHDIKSDRDEKLFNFYSQVHTNGSHQNGKRGSSTVSIYRHGDPDTAMGGETVVTRQNWEPAQCSVLGVSYWDNMFKDLRCQRKVGILTIAFMCVNKIPFCVALNAHWSQGNLTPSCFDFMCVNKLSFLVAE